MKYSFKNDKLKNDVERIKSNNLILGFRYAQHATPKDFNKYMGEMYPEIKNSRSIQGSKAAADDILSRGIAHGRHRKISKNNPGTGK